MATKFQLYIFPNGRVYFLDYELLSKALEAEKEILIICNAWSGGYTRVIGGEKKYDPYYSETDENGELLPYYDMYSYEIKDEEFNTEDLNKFYKIIFTSGEQIRMETGEQANSYQGDKFFDWDSSEDAIVDRKSMSYPIGQKWVPESELAVQKVRQTVDSCATVRFLPKKDPDIQKEMVKTLIAYRIIDKDSEKYL